MFFMCRKTHLPNMLENNFFYFILLLLFCLGSLFYVFTFDVFTKLLSG